jgi:alkylation response protein AidB-like acyl-CoA dehydrogenase
MEPSFSPSLPALKAQSAQIVDEVVAPCAAGCHWPRESLDAFAAAGLTGLQVPARLGGHGCGLGELLFATELIGAACPSTALCFGMHCVGTAVIAAKATPWQEEHYLRPIAAGRHLTTLALSESGSGAHFHLPGTTLTPDGAHFLVDGVKQFVTNGGHADSYVISTLADAGDTAVHLANEAMTICGGAAYRDNSRVAQMLRDARASHVMSPTTDLLRLWTGRSLLGLPLL